VAEARAAGTIYDLGYQRYHGARLGRRHAIKTLMAYSLRTAFGVGRGPRARIVPFIVTALVSLPAIVQMGIASFMGSGDMISYSGHLEFTALLLAIFTAAQTPEMLVSDRQYGVMSLYLSRPMSGSDYIGAKLAAIVGAMLVLTLGPQLFLFAGKVFASATPWTAFLDEYRKLAPIVGGTFLVSCFLGSIGLAISSIFTRRGFASAAVIGFFLLLPATSALVRSFATGDVKRYVVLANPTYLMMGFVNWLFDIEAKRRSVIGRADIPGATYFYTVVGVCVLCSVFLWLRYRRSEP
jgi:ABC-2 type transport system permease protein